jgi:hypothetical protein
MALLAILLLAVLGAVTRMGPLVVVATACEALLIAAIIWALVTDTARGREWLEALLTPTVLRLIATELRMLAVLPLLVIRALRPPSPNEFPYDRSNNFGLLAFGFAVIGLLEGAVVAFLFMGRISWIAWLDMVATAYAVLWLLGLALAPRVYPHRLVGDSLQVRLGFLYLAAPSLVTIVSADRKASLVGWRSECAIEGTSAFFRIDGRTDVLISLSTPCRIDRLVRPPALVDRIYLAVDNVPRFLQTVDAQLGEAPPRERVGSP